MDKDNVMNPQWDLVIPLAVAMIVTIAFALILIASTFESKNADRAVVAAVIAGKDVVLLHPVSSITLPR